MNTKVGRKKETGTVELRQIRGILRPELSLSLFNEKCEHPGTGIISNAGHC